MKGKAVTGGKAVQVGMGRPSRQPLTVPHEVSIGFRAASLEAGRRRAECVERLARAESEYPGGFGLTAKHVAAQARQLLGLR